MTQRGRPPAVDQASVIAAAVKILSEEGAGGLTVRRLADVVGVSRQVVYTRFGSLGGLVDALYRQGFAELAASGAHHNDLTGIDRVIAAARTYRAHALANPEIYQVMFERPFRSYVPSEESRAIALAAFEPLVAAIASTGRPRRAARMLALTVLGAMHGIVQLELQGYFDFEAPSDRRIVDAVTALVAHA